jgi:uncharacterized membrane protein
MKQKLSLFFMAFFVYAIVDIIYNVAIGLKIDERFYKKAGILDIFSKDLGNSWLFLIFFVVIALGNVILVILPAIRACSTSQALKNGFLLGIVAYTTYAIPLAVIIQNYPVLLAPIHILGGGFFSLCTSGFCTWFYLKRLAKKP